MQLLTNEALDMNDIGQRIPQLTEAKPMSILVFSGR